MTAPRRDETTMLSDAEIDAMLNESPWLRLWLSVPSREECRQVARAIERAVVSALSARGGEPSEAEKLAALRRVRSSAEYVCGRCKESWGDSWTGAYSYDKALIHAGIALGRRHAVSPEALADAKREGAREALTAFANCEKNTRHYQSGIQTWTTLGRLAEEYRDTFYRAPLPVPPAPKGVRLSDGSVFERMFWDLRGGERNVWTFDIVTRKGEPGSESRRCFKSVEEMRERFVASWADWQRINALLALAEAPDGQ